MSVGPEILVHKRFDGSYAPEGGGNLVLVRHGTSEGNTGNRWTGWKDVALAKQGYDDAVAVAKFISVYNIAFDGIYTSRLRRAVTTARIIEEALFTTPLYREKHITNIPTISTEALNERDFGIYTWWKRDEVIDKVGEEEFLRLRRSWDARIEGGESMEDVSNRVVPVLRDEIIPRVVAGENILFVAHSNVVRVSLAELHELPPGETHETLVVRNREAHMLKFVPNGTIVDHEILREDKISEKILDHEDHAS